MDVPAESQGNAARIVRNVGFNDGAIHYYPAIMAEKLGKGGDHG